MENEHRKNKEIILALVKKTVYPGRKWPVSSVLGISDPKRHLAQIIIFVSKYLFLVGIVNFSDFLSKLIEKTSKFFDIENRGFINSQVPVSLNDATVGNILATVPNVLFMKLNTNTTPLNDTFQIQHFLTK